MSGERLLLDTNAAVALLQGHTGLVTLTKNSAWVGISVITALEFSGFAGLTDADRALFAEFTARVDVVDLAFTDQVLIDTINGIRRSRAIKLPDAIILATAAVKQAVLVTRDDQLLRLNGVLAGAEVRGFESG
jgi:predicted nucleic acid-binding protein